MTAPATVPAWGRGTLADVLPSVLSAMGAAGHAPVVDLPGTRRVCLFLVDGLGLDLLAGADPADAPFLRSLLPTAFELDAGFPSSTPISLCSLGTGRPPGEHGIVGFSMHVPPVAAILECLSWVRYGSRESLLGVLAPETLQPIEPLFGTANPDAIAVTVVSLAEHLRSGLTRAAFRGARFDSIDGFDDLDDRVARVRAGLALADRALVYTYDGRLDAAAHERGVASGAWRSALREVDRVARGLAATLPPGGLLLVTGDHGGIDVPAARRLDLADRDDLSAGVAWLSGDPRTRHIHAEPGSEAAVLAAWRDGLDATWTVLSRDEAIGAGLFGPVVTEGVRPRIGDVVAIAGGSAGMFDRRRFPWEQRLVAFHGALSRAELKVPLLVATT